MTKKTKLSNAQLKARNEKLVKVARKSDGAFLIIKIVFTVLGSLLGIAFIFGMVYVLQSCTVNLLT